MTRINAPKGPVAHAILAQGWGRPTHPRLAEIGGFSERSITNVIRELAPSRMLSRGHPATLGPGLGLVVGVSLGMESLRAGVVDANGELVVRVREPPLAGQLEQPPHRVLERIRGVVASALAAALEQERLWSSEEEGLSLLGVAVAWPSPVDRAGRPGGRALRDAAWRRKSRAGHVPTLQERVAQALGVPFDPSRVHALNDVNAHALAVGFDTARQRAFEDDDDRWRVALVVRVGGGVGAATIQLAPHSRRRLSFIDSQLIAGTNGFAGELGHLPIDSSVIHARNRANPFKRQLADLSYRKYECSCGRKHHLEAFASGAALVRRLQESGYAIADDSRGKTGLIREMLEGEPDDLQVHALRDAGRIVGHALAGPILMLDPYSITLTGSLATEDLKQGVLLEREVWGNAAGDTARVRYLKGDEGAFAGVRGAALAVMRRYIYRQMPHVLDRGPSAAFDFKRPDLERLTHNVAHS